MKKSLFLLGLCLASLLPQAQSQTFVYSMNGEKVYFEKNEDIQYLHFVPDADSKIKETVLNDIKSLTSQLEMITPEIYRCELPEKQVSKFMKVIESMDIVSSYSNEYRLPKSNTVRWVTKEMYIKVKEGYSIAKVMQLAHLSYHFAEPVIFQTFFIKIENEDIFAASQRLFETGTVEYALPAFYYLQPAEMPLYARDNYSFDKSSNNWNLRGIESTTMGINAINAWGITTGNSNIKVAIVDDGILYDHNGLYGNTVIGYTSPMLFSTADGAANYADINGTQVAGIISSTNNTQANYGIAKDSKITSVKVRDRKLRYTQPPNPPVWDYFCSDQDIIDGLLWAKNNNVDIVNISWIFDEITQGSASLANLANVINDLKTNGRNGKGIVIIASSGNQGYNYVAAPASSGNIIAVGATETKGKRVTNFRWASNYGYDLDIVAPGENITTTCGYKNDCYTDDYERTWVAAAHVSGVAALMLSINPNLTVAQVKTIIEQTAYKAHEGSGNGQYSYQTTSGRPNGTWHSEMGYGLVDAYKAVINAIVFGQPQTITGESTVSNCNEYTYTSGITNTSYFTYQWLCSSNLVFTSSTDETSVRVTPIGAGAGTITLKIYNQGNVVFTLTKNVTISGSGFTQIPVATAPLIITSNTTWANQNHLVAVPVTVQAGATLTITGKVYFTYDNTITVKPGGKIVVNGGTLTNACTDKMWRGIRVAGNSLLSQNPINQGVLELKNAVIENARDAISTSELKPNGEYDWNNKHGGIIKAENTTFKNNRRSVEFMKYPPDGVNPIPQNVSYFENCKFIVDNNNLFALNNTALGAHITMWAVTGVQITGCEFENNITKVADRGPAIYTIDAGYTVDQYCSLYATGTSCSNCETRPKLSLFKGFKRAVESSYSEKQYALVIDRSKFEGNSIGILVTGKNDFRISRLDMQLNTIYDNYPIGIFLDNCTGYKVEGNTIYSNGTDRSTGIFVNNPGYNENKIYRNAIKKIRYGIQVDEIDQMAQQAVRYPTTGLQFGCNDMDENYSDIDVLFPSRIRPIQNYAYGVAGNVGADNLFSPNAIFNFKVDDRDLQVTYYYKSGSRKEPVYRTPNVMLNTVTYANPCNSSLCENIIYWKSYEAALEQYQELNKKYAEMMLTFYAKKYDKILTDYFNGIVENEKLLKEAMIYHEEILALTNSMAEISNEMLFKLKMDSVIDLTQIRDWYDEMYNLSAKYALVETYYQLGKYEEGFKTLDLIPEMYKLNENEQIEHNNYVSLFTFKNKIRESGRTIAQLNKAEIEELIYYAKASHGLSSVMAKGILCFFYEICLEDEMPIELEDEVIKGLNDETAENPSKSVTPASFVCENTVLENIKIYPNPGKDYITVISDVENANFELIDAMGSVQKTIKLKIGNNTINTSSLQRGVYMYRIILFDKIVTGKWIKM